MSDLYKRDKRELNNRIHLGEELKLSINGSPSIPWGGLFKFGLIILGGIAGYYCIFNPIGLDTQVEWTQMIMGLFITALLCESLVYICRTKWQAIVLPLLPILVMSYFYVDEIKNGFTLVINEYINKLNAGYDFSFPLMQENSVNTGKEITTLACLIATLLVWVCGLSANLRHFKSLSLFLELSCAGIGFIVGLTLKPQPLFLMAFYVLMVIVMEFEQLDLAQNETYSWNIRCLEDNSRMMPALIIGIIFLISIGLGTLILPKDKFYGDWDVEGKREGLQHIVESIKNGSLDFDIFQDKAVGGLSGGRLTNTEIEFDGKTMMKLEMPDLIDRVYLSGYTGATYTGSKWRENKDAKDEYEDLCKYYDYEYSAQNLNSRFNILLGACIMNKPEFFADISSVRLWNRITSINDKSDYYFSLYGSSLMSPEGKDAFYEFDEDNCIKLSDNVEDYSTEIFYSKDVDIPWIEENAGLVMSFGDEKFRNFEYSYRDYVYRNYLELPENDEYLRDIVDLMGNELLGATVSEKAEAVVEYLKNNYNYVLNPGELPEDMDYAEYFLTRNKKGYCAHYATSAVLLFRELGVPARYVEGYSLDTVTANKENCGDAEYEKYENEGATFITDKCYRYEITDKEAHAWVEIYLDNYGWFPVEVTNIRRGNALPVQNEITDIPENNEELAPTAIPEIQNENKAEELPEPSVENKVNTIPIFVFAGAIVLGLILLALLSIYISYCLKRKKWNRAFTAADNNARILLCYATYLRIKNEFEQNNSDNTDEKAEKLYHLAETAKFSPHMAEDEEVSWVREYLADCINVYIKQEKRYNTLYFMYILGYKIFTNI